MQKKKTANQGPRRKQKVVGKEPEREKKEKNNKVEPRSETEKVVRNREKIANKTEERKRRVWHIAD